MRKAFRFRAYPNKNSEVNSIRTLSTCRHLYNDSLAERKRQATLNRLKKQFDVFRGENLNGYTMKIKRMSYQNQRLISRKKYILRYSKTS